MAVVIGAAFTDIIKVIVRGLITPLLGVFGGIPDFSGVVFTVNNSRFLIGEVINALITTRIIEQFIGQIFGVMLLRRSQPGRPRPFMIWLYPLPCLVALVGWLYLYVSADRLLPCTDCGLVPRTREAARGKLAALTAGADLVRREVGG